MRKVTLLLLLSVLSVVTARAAETKILYQGLSRDATGWNVYPDNVLSDWMWENNMLSAYTHMEDNGVTYFTTETISIPENVTVTASFNQSCGTDRTLSELYADGCSMVVRVDGTADWVSVNTVYDQNGSTEFTEATVNLNAYCGKTIYIGFKYSSESYIAWNIKDLVVSYTDDGGGGGGGEQPGDLTATFSPSSGETVDAGSIVTVTPEEGATIISYTIDGTTTDVNSGEPCPITLPLIEGNCTLTVKLSKDSKENDVTATYYLSAPLPGDIIFSIESGTVVGANQEITISSENATRLEYNFGDKNTFTINASSGTITLPGVSGSYTLYVTAYRATGDLLGQKDTSINFTVDAPSPGPITFNPVSGSTVEAGSTVTISSADADRFVYKVNGTGFSATGSQVIVTLPAQAGTATIDVTAYRGDMQLTSQATYTVLAPKPGDITITPNGGNVVAGTTVTIESANAESLAYVFTLEGAEEGASTTVSGPKADIPTPATAGTYTLKVTATLGEETKQGSATFTVEALMPGAIVFSPAPEGDETEVTVGPGATITFSSENADRLSYTIEGGETKEVNGDTGSALLPTAPGKYTVTVTAYRGAQQLEGSITCNVVLPDLGAVVFNPASGTELGEGDNVTVTADYATKYVYTLTETGSEEAGEEQTVDDTKAVISFNTTGNWTLSVKAYRDDEFVEGTATYTVTPPKPGVITFTPEPGEVKPRTWVYIASAQADKIDYTLTFGGEVIESSYVTDVMASIEMPETDGEYTLTVIAHRGEVTRDATVTYTVVTPAQAGEITIEPIGGVVLPGREVTITSEGADRVKAQINGGNFLVAEGSTLTFALPTDAGTYILHAVAVFGEQEVTAEAEFIIKDTEVTNGDFLLLESLSTLQSGMNIVIADAEHNPQYIMAAPSSKQSIFPQVSTTITNGVVVRLNTAVVLPVEKTANGNWYIGDADGYLYCDADGTLSYSKENKTEFSITLDQSTKAATIKTVSEPAGLTLYHTTLDEGAGFGCYSSSATGRSKPSIYYQYTSAPEEPVFYPLSGVLREAGETITVTATGASRMTYSIYTLYGELIEEVTVYGQKAEIDVIQSCDIIVTAFNPNGSSHKSAEYYISNDESLDFDGLDPEDFSSYYYWRHYSFNDVTNEPVTRVWNFTGSNSITNGIFYLCASRAETDPPQLRSYTYTRSQIILPSAGVTSIKATFSQIVNNLDQLEQQGCKFIVREYKNEYAEDPEGTCEEGWTYYNPFNTNGATQYSAKVMRKAEEASGDPVNETVTVDMTNYKGKRVQVGFYYKTIEDADNNVVDSPWYVQNLEIRHYTKTSIDDIEDDADVDTCAPVEYYNLRGIRVSSENLAPGFYIRRQGTKATKILIK